MKLTGPSLSEIPRHELIAAALELGIDRPELLSPEQLREKIRAASAGVAKEAQPGLGRVSLFSVARNLIASVVERGLNLPDAARVIRDTVRPSPRHRPPLPTVTLAQIYLAQGYADRAIVTLSQVIEREPNNYTAVELYQRLARPAEGAAQSAALDGVTPSPAERLTIAPGLAPSAELWYSPNTPLTRSLRDGLVLVQREPRQVTVYWELSERHAAALPTTACEVRVACYSGDVEPRAIHLPVHASFGWALIELLDDEVPCACLRVEEHIVAVAQRVSVSFELAAPELLFGARPRAFWNDLVARALS